MTLKLRLARHGAKKRPFYHIVVADSRSPRDGRYIEKVGVVDPLMAKTDEKRVQYDAERVKYWLGKGAKPTDRVARYLSANGLAEWRRGNNPKKAEPGAKAKERAAARAEKAAAPESPVEEAPADEAAAE